MKQALLIATLLTITACGTTVPEGQSAYGTTAMTRWTCPECYEALVAENDQSKKEGFGALYQGSKPAVVPAVKPIDVRGL